MDERRTRLLGLTLALALAVPAARAEAAAAPVSAVGVYVRVSTVALAGPRKATRHVAIEVRYSDGRAAWIGAYPNGLYQNFATTGGRLLCEFNAEPRTADASLYVVATGPRAATLVGPLTKRCQAFNAAQPVTYWPVPTVAGDLPDNDFVFGLLRSQGYIVRPEFFAAAPASPKPNETQGPRAR